MSLPFSTFSHHPVPAASYVKVEDLVKRLFSAEHLHLILSNHAFFSRFSSFLNRFKPHLVPRLVRYLEMRKAIKAIEYANTIVRKIRWPSHTDYSKFNRLQAASTDVRFEGYASRELLLICSEALPAFIAHNLVSMVADLVARDISGDGVRISQALRSLSMTWSTARNAHCARCPMSNID